jgi:enoyl-CoA hydratase
VRLPRIVGQGRALDMILTGRPVGAAEALSWGLADRVVPAGTARAAAEALAAELAALPPVCLQGDRASVYEAAGRAEDEAMRVEFGHGMRTLGSGEAAAGAARFAAGAGRHGAAD